MNFPYDENKKIASSLLLILAFSLFTLSCKKNKPAPNPPKSSEKAITSFVFEAVDNSTVLLADVAGSIGTDSIIVKIDQGLNISSLVPTITYSGSTISPANTVAQNFNNIVSYTVTADDGSTKKYFVKIMLVTANQKIFVGSDDGNLYALNALHGTLLWKYTTGGAIQSSPTLINNTVYVGSNDKYLYAIDALTGVLKWKYLTAAPIRSESPVVSNGKVFIGCANAYPDGTVYALNATTGALIWNNLVAVPTSPTVSGGKVYSCTMGGSYYALDEVNGITVWSRNICLTRSNPAISNGKIYIEGSTGTGQIICVDANTGNPIWNTACQSANSGPTVDDGSVYISSSVATLQYLEAFDATTGNFKWRYSPLHVGNLNSPVTSCPVSSGNYIYGGFHYGQFYALNKLTGTIAWQFGSAIESGVWFSNPAVANGVVYVGGYDKYVYALNALTGVQKWKFLTTGTVYSGPCILDSDGVIFHSGASGSKN
ncbi:MAG TPA: PQQ-binding-like beta-propeller repeat protein [Chitinophagaceae bacterium]